MSIPIKIEVDYKEIEETKQKIAELTLEKKKLQQVQRDASAAGQKETAEYKTRKEKIRELSAELKIHNSTLLHANGVEVEHSMLLDDKRNQLATLKDEYSQLTKEEQTKTAAGKKLKAQIDELKLSFDSQAGSTKENTKELSGWQKGINKAKAKLDELHGAAGNLPEPLKGVTQGILSATKASISFIATPIGAVIGALSLAFKAVHTYLSSTTEGLEVLDTITSYTTATIKVLTDKVAEFGKILFKFLSNPGEAWKEMKDFASDFAENGIGDIIDKIDEMGSKMAELKKATKDLYNAETELVTKKAEHKTKIDELRDAYNDESLSIQERSNKLKDAQALEKEILQDELKNAEERARIHSEQIKNGEFEASKLDEAKRKEAELNAEVLAKKRELTSQEKEGQAQVTSFISSEYEKRAQKARETAEKIAAINAQTAEIEKKQTSELATIQESANAATSEASMAMIEDVMERYDALQQAGQLEYDNAVKAKASATELAEIKRNNEEQELAFLAEEATKAAENAELRKQFEFERLNSFDQQRQKLAEYEAENAAAGVDEVALANFVAEEKKKINQAEAESFFQIREEAINNEYEAKKAKIDKEIEDETLKKEALLQLEAERVEGLAQLYEEENVAVLTKEAGLDESMAEIEAMRQEKFGENELLKQELMQQTADVQKQIDDEESKRNQEKFNKRLEQLAGIASKAESFFKDEIKRLEDKGKAEGKSEEEIAKMTAKARKRAKQAAIAGALIATFQSAITAYNSAAAVPVVGPVLGGIAAAAAVLMGMKQVQKIKAQEYATGGFIHTGNELPGFSKTGDNTLILAQPGELILNQRQQGNLGLTPHVLKAAGVPGFATGGFVDGGMSARAITTPVQQSAQETREVQVPVLVLEDFETKQGTKVKVENALSI